MELLQGDAFDGLFRGFTRTAFHLEVEDSYRTPEEAGPFGKFLAGQPDDFAWHQPWLTLVRGAAGAGKHITRVRVVSVPHVPYTRWGLTVAPLNIAAGEDIRWLPRHLAADIELTADDYWLLDDDLVVFTIFEPSGRFGGGAATRDQRIVNYCRTVQRAAWKRAIPYDRYVASESTSA